MARIKTRLPKGGTLILMWIGVILLLGLVGWGIGWLVPRVLAPRETPTPTPTQMARPTATSTTVDVPTGIPTVPEATDIPQTPTATGPEGVSEPTSESVAEPTAVPVVEPTLIAEENEVVQSGDGLFQVCRRHCPERWPPDDDALTTYAQQVADLNGLSWPDPALSPGQILKMPPCP
jgi:hypothetical protein